MDTERRTEQVEGLALYLYDDLIGVITHYTGGKNILVFSPEYTALSVSKRPVFTLTQLISDEYLTTPQIHNQKLPPVLSNLLPEGALRELISRSLKVHIDNEFPLLAYTGANLAGALVVSPLERGSIPLWALSVREQTEPIQIEVQNQGNKFSLAGVQMKFSSVRKDGRFNIGSEIDSDSWIIKTPSTVHQNVPQNEYSAMRLAEAAGIEIPEIKLVPLSQLENLTAIQLPHETEAFAIRRFDRSEEGRIHTEDFAQIFGLYAPDKYGKRNYEQIANTLYRYAGGLADVQQMARRLLVNILLGNADAHLKNWTLIYKNKFVPSLSPAYDIVFTKPYVTDEKEVALNMAKEKSWYEMNMSSFKQWSERIGAPFPAIKPHLDDVIRIARSTWVEMLADLPMKDTHKAMLREHWRTLCKDFRID